MTHPDSKKLLGGKDQPHGHDQGTPDPVSLSEPNPNSKTFDEGVRFGETAPPPEERSPPEEPKARRNADPEDGDAPSTLRVTLEVDYWPKKQPKQATEGVAALTYQENRIHAGEAVTLPYDEAMDLIEDGKAKRSR